MELGLSLGDASKPLGFMEKAREVTTKTTLGFCMGLSIGSSLRQDEEDDEDREKTTKKKTTTMMMQKITPSDQHNEAETTTTPAATQREKHSAPFQLQLLPHTPISRIHGFPWAPSENGSSEGGGSCGNIGRGLDVNRLPTATAAEEEGGAASSSDPNSAASSFQMDFFIHRGGAGNEGEGERASSRASDEDENGNPRKKLRLSKEQSAFLEESFKEHSTLNPKQKLALAKQLGLRPRQVEVWFQNRRARTKLKQTEVDCEYLKRCCETLTEENRRLHKELQELRALKTSTPFYMQLPATTLTMCPSCERVATTTTSASAAPTPAPTTSAAAAVTVTTARPVLPIFSNTKPSPSASTGGGGFLRNG